MERTLPLFNGSAVAGGDPARPYHNARAPVYVVSGAVVRHFPARFPPFPLF